MEIVPYEHKVQYYETDQMGIVHHSNYIRWFEEARVDFLDQVDMSYARMEELYTPGARINRPAYKVVSPPRPFVPLSQR